MCTYNLQLLPPYLPHHFSAQIQVHGCMLKCVCVRVRVCMRCVHACLFRCACSCTRMSVRMCVCLCVSARRTGKSSTMQMQAVQYRRRQGKSGTKQTQTKVVEQLHIGNAADVHLSTHDVCKDSDHTTGKSYRHFPQASPTGECHRRF